MRTLRRKDRERPEDFALAVTDNCDWAVMATVNSDGSPYCIPLSPAREGEWLYFHSAVEGHKLDNLKADNRVCISCVGNAVAVPEAYSLAYESAVINGKAQEVTDREERIHALKLICQRYTPESTAGFDAAMEKNFNRTAVWKIHIDHICGKARPK